MNGVSFLSLSNEEYRTLQAFIDKEITPFECGRINRRFNISHIRYITEQVTGLNITSGLLAQLLRQRKIPAKDIKGRTHFAISDEFFINL